MRHVTTANYDTLQITYNAPDDKRWLDDVLEAEYGHTQIGEYARFYHTQL